HVRFITAFTDPMPLFGFSYNSVKRDPNGHYHVDHLPHDNGKPMMLMIGSYDDSVQEQQWRPLKFEPGKTAKVDVGATGATVKGRVVPASDADAITGAKGSIHLTLSANSPADEWPTDIATAAESGNPLYR